MQEEIDAAVEWWAKQLEEKPSFDNGEPMHSFMFGLIKHDPLTAKQIEDFKKNFKKELKARFKKEDWRNSEPDFAAYFRCIGVDYGPDISLSKACKDSGFSPTNRFPIKTNMWINPGSVKVSCGYSAPIEVIYTSKQPTEPESE